MWAKCLACYLERNRLPENIGLLSTSFSVSENFRLFLSPPQLYMLGAMLSPSIQGNVFSRVLHGIIYFYLHLRFNVHSYSHKQEISAATC